MSACGRERIYSCPLSDFPTFCTFRTLGESTAVLGRKYGSFYGKVRQSVVDGNILIKT